MLTVFARSIIIYIFLLFAMRLMGKRQLGELQPFEFAITMIVAELACIPMSETAIPLSYGLIPIFSLFVLHLFITKIATKSIRFRKFLNGQPVILIDKQGINSDLMKNVDMNINDLMDSLRAKGFFSLSEIAFAILETNGTLSVLPKNENKPLTPKDMNIQIEPAAICFTLVCEGKLMEENISLAGTTKEEVAKVLEHYKIKQKEVFILTLCGGYDMFLQPYNAPCITDNYINIAPISAQEGS